MVYNTAQAYKDRKTLKAHMVLQKIWFLTKAIYWIDTEEYCVSFSMPLLFAVGLRCATAIVRMLLSK